MRYVYCAGPMYGSGHVVENVKRALDAGGIVREAGMVPFVPHLMMFWHFCESQRESYWLHMCKAWLEKCDVMVRQAGESPGSSLEELWAHESGIPAYRYDGGEDLVYLLRCVSCNDLEALKERALWSELVGGAT